MIQCDPKVEICVKNIFVYCKALLCTCHEKWHTNFTKFCACHEENLCCLPVFFTNLLALEQGTRAQDLNPSRVRSFAVCAANPSDSVFSSSPKSANGGYDFDFDFARACPQAALFETQAMANQNISECDKTLQNRPSAASTTPDPLQSYEMQIVPQGCPNANSDPAITPNKQFLSQTSWPSNFLTSSADNLDIITSAVPSRLCQYIFSAGHFSSKRFGGTDSVIR